MKVLQNGSSYENLSGKSFTVYTDSAKTKIAKGTVYDEHGIANSAYELSNLSSGIGGSFFIGELAYGTYYVAEEGVTGMFVITIDNGGVVKITSTTPKIMEPQKTVSLS